MGKHPTSKATERLAEAWHGVITGNDIGISVFSRNHTPVAFVAQFEKLQDDTPEQRKFTQIDFFVWTGIKLLAERARLPFAIAVHSGDEMWVANWPHTTGMEYNYSVEDDAVWVEIPSSEFKRLGE